MRGRVLDLVAQQTHNPMGKIFEVRYSCALSPNGWTAQPRGYKMHYINVFVILSWKVSIECGKRQQWILLLSHHHRTYLYLSHHHHYLFLILFLYNVSLQYSLKFLELLFFHDLVLWCLCQRGQPNHLLGRTCLQLQSTLEKLCVLLQLHTTICNILAPSRRDCIYSFCKAISPRASSQGHIKRPSTIGFMG